MSGGGHDATAVAATIAGETLTLCAERAVYWHARRMLLVAGPHFGKAASFRALGVRVPRGTTIGTLGRLDAVSFQSRPSQHRYGISKPARQST